MNKNDNIYKPVSPGRPPTYDTPMRQTGIYLPEHHLEHIDQRVAIGLADSRSEYIRKLIDSDIEAEPND